MDRRQQTSRQAASTIRSVCADHATGSQGRSYRMLRANTQVALEIPNAPHDIDSAHTIIGHQRSPTIASERPTGHELARTKGSMWPLINGFRNSQRRPEFDPNNFRPTPMLYYRIQCEPTACCHISGRVSGGSRHARKLEQGGQVARVRRAPRALRRCQRAPLWSASCASPPSFRRNGPLRPIRGSSTRTLPKAPFMIFAVPNTSRRVPVAGPTAAFSTSRPPWLGAPCDACIEC